MDVQILAMPATAVLVAVLARIVARWRPMPWRLALAAFLSSLAGLAALLASPQEFDVSIVAVGIALAGGTTWAGLANPARERWAFSFLAGVAYGSLVTGLAWLDAWWMTTVAIAAAFAAGILALFFARGSPWDDPGAWGLAPQGPERAVHPGPGPAAKAPSAAPPPAAGVPIRCPSCGLAGQVPAARAGSMLSCPRCKGPVRVPGGRPPPPSAGVPPAAARRP